MSMKSLTLLSFALAVSPFLTAQVPVNLGSDSSFAVLGASAVTNTGPTVVNGNLGVSPGTAITGFPPGIVLAGTIHAGDAVSLQAQSDLTAAYNDAAGRHCPGPALAGDIGGTTILPGVYCASTSLGITGTVTLNGNGNPNAVFIFQIGSTLITAASNSMVRLIGGAQASNVFWQVGSSATLGTNTIFNGTILAQVSVTVASGAALNGRALARTGAVTLADNAITAPPVPGPPATLALTCSYPSGTVGQPYTSSLVATGGLPPYTYAISAGSLPTSLLLNPATGAIRGTPTVAGAFSDTSRVTDSTSTSAASTCGITIAPLTTSGLSLTCAANTGQVGQPYVSSLVAAGGAPPYTYSITVGSLPTGLTLAASSGAISGTPTVSGRFSYTSKVVDSTSASTTSNCGPTIIAAAAPPPPPPTPAPPSLILVMVGLACGAIYIAFERRRRFRRS
jgi:hypothetical protein